MGGNDVSSAAQGSSSVQVTGMDFFMCSSSTPIKFGSQITC